MKGEVKWIKDGKKVYTEHYENLKPTGEVQRDAYQEREIEQMIKVAMLLSISKGDEGVNGDHILQAKKFMVCLMEETAPRIERLTTHPRMALVQEIQDHLRKYETLTRRQLLKRVYRGLAYGEVQFSEAIRILHLTGTIKQLDRGHATNPTYTLIKKKEGI